MKFTPDLQPAIFVKRYKRFLADVILPNGETITVHCPNTGSMRGCIEPGCRVMISKSNNPKRKYPHSLELTEMNGNWIGVNTAKTNHLVREAIEKGVIKEIGFVDTIKPEIKTSEGSRLDFLLQKGEQNIFMEVKNCTLVENSIAMFPDAVTTRGTKHLNELIELKKEGHQAIIFFCIQRMDGTLFTPAAHIDPIYAKTLKTAASKGVLVLAYQATIQPPQSVKITKQLSVKL